MKKHILHNLLLHWFLYWNLPQINWKDYICITTTKWSTKIPIHEFRLRGNKTKKERKNKQTNKQQAAALKKKNDYH